MSNTFINGCLQTAIISLGSIGYANASADFDIKTQELVINSIRVGSDVFDARLSTTDIKTFTLISAKPVTEKRHLRTNASYDPATAVAILPSVKTFLPNKKGAPSFFQVKLRLIPGTNPLQFTLDEASEFNRLPSESRSSSIALTSDDRYLVVANKSSKSVSIFEVRNEVGTDTQSKLAEISVGSEPRYIAISPDNKWAYVSNSASGSVSVIEINGANSKVIETIIVGSEPRGIAVTPNGHLIYVANHTSRSVTEIDTQTRKVIKTIKIPGANPMAIAISNDGDASDEDETVYVTDFFSRTIEGRRDGFDNAKQGMIYHFTVGTDKANVIPIAPLIDSGFVTDRSQFCATTASAGDKLHSELFCPDKTAGADNTKIKQGVYPNQFYSAIIRDDKLYLPNVGAAPEPPIKFNVNVQALVNVLDTDTKKDIPSAAVNLNNLIKKEVQPEKTDGSLTRVFGSDIVAIDGDEAGENFLIVSRGGNYVIQATNSEQGLRINAPNAIRYQTGNIPTGIVMSEDGKRAYTNNEVGYSVSVLDLENKTVLHRDIPSSTLPNPGTKEHRELVGKLTFFTALGTPNNGLFSTPIRRIIPVDHRNKASDNGWSSCASCHNDGLADGVTWMFPTGPRQTIPLDAFFAKKDSSNQRISNWNAVRGSVTDFNNNSRNIQGGKGFADDPSVVFNHGSTTGVSDALDAMTDWVKTVRSPIMPAPTDIAAFNNGKEIFKSQCAACHGGVKWTKSQVVYPNNPTFGSNPLKGGTVLDSRIINAGPQIVSFTNLGKTITFLESVSSFDATDPFEIRGAGGAIGKGAVGGKGFNIPSLLGVAYHGFYFHDGSANTLNEVFNRHTLRNGQKINASLSTAQIGELKMYLKSIDDKSEPVTSETDVFLQ